MTPKQPSPCPTPDVPGPHAGDASDRPGEDYMTLREACRMIWRHRWKITVATLAAVAATAASVLLQPVPQTAQGFLQVIPPPAVDGRTDKDLFETSIISHLQRIQSSFIAELVAQQLDPGSGDQAGFLLQKKVIITRPSKSDLIRIEATDPLPDRAVRLVAEWIGQYLASVRKNNISRSLNQVRTLIKIVQAEMIAKQGSVQQLSERAAQIEPLITVSKIVDDQPLWDTLATGAVAPETLQRLADIQFKGQEENKEYTALKSFLFNADQMLGAATTMLSFYRDVERALESQGAAATNAAQPPPAPEAAQYAETLVKDVDIIQFGTPSLLPPTRGLLKKTAMACVVTLFAASLFAFLVEWFRGLDT